MDTKFEDIISEIRQTVIQYPNNCAIIEDAIHTISYMELWNQASRFAEWIREKEQPCEYVIIEMPKSIRYLIALLGCWMTGKAFVPLGSDLPESRKDYIKSQLRNYILVSSDTYPSLSGRQPLILTQPLSPGTPAYMIFSSGTTGNPKGIIVGHSGLVNLARCQREAFLLDSESRNLFFLSINFDASISDILTTLTSGATLVIETGNSISISANLLNIISEREITHADLPPSLLKVLDADKCPESLRTIIIGGEAADGETVRKWASKVNLVNVYGPTEATVCTSMCRYTEDWKTPVIGEELDGVRYHICHNGNLNATEGELWISGTCLAIGYYNNKDLTEKKFPVLNGIRYYRTSDHVRRLPSGETAFLGRYDRQVKLHGQLIELEEVEENLKRLRFVKGAAVIKRQASACCGKEMLVAFVEADETNTDNARQKIYQFLRHHIPAWMIPGHIELLDRLPRVTSGKTDLKALENIPLDIKCPTQEEPYSSAKEEAVARIMADILKTPRINPHDDFLELGADSLDTMLLISRLQSELNIGTTLAHIRDNASPAAISRMGNSTKSMAVSSQELKSEWEIPINSSVSETAPADGMLLITGATGFLGSHILAEILQRAYYAHKDIICLIRCDSPEHGRIRLSETFGRYGLQCNRYERITIVPSDLSEDCMGLDGARYKHLTQNVSEVFHCAATVNMMADYHTLRASNVVATRHIMEFCLSGCKKKLNYASTLSVFVSTSRNEGVAIEEDRLEESCTIYGGYGQTKYVCEKMLLRIPSSKCNTNILRYGLLCGDSISGISAPKDFLGMFIRGAKALGSLPLDHTGQLGIDISPIDMATRISLDIATRSENGIYHIAAENPLKYNQLCRFLNQANGLRIVEDFAGWQASMQPLRQNPDVSALEMSLCRMDAKTYENMRYMDLFQTTNIRFDMANTHRITNYRIYQDEQLIKKYINHETV